MKQTKHYFLPNNGSKAVPCRLLLNGKWEEPWPDGDPLKSAHLVRSMLGKTPLLHGTLGLLLIKKVHTRITSF